MVYCFPLLIYMSFIHVPISRHNNHLFMSGLIIAIKSCYDALREFDPVAICVEIINNVSSPSVIGTDLIRYKVQ